MYLPCPRRPRLLAGIVVLGAALVAAALPAHEAQAAFVGCRSDPIAYLDNGIKVNLSAAVATDRNDIQHIVYVLHVPQGIHLNRVIYTAGELGHREALVFIADGAPGVYSSTTFVETGSTGVLVTATTTAVDQLTDTPKARAWAQGHDHEDIAVQVAQP